MVFYVERDERQCFSSETHFRNDFQHKAWISSGGQSRSLGQVPPDSFLHFRAAGADIYSQVPTQHNNKFKYCGRIEDDNIYLAAVVLQRNCSRPRNWSTPGGRQVVTWRLGFLRQNILSASNDFQHLLAGYNLRHSPERQRHCYTSRYGLSIG